MIYIVSFSVLWNWTVILKIEFFCTVSNMRWADNHLKAHPASYYLIRVFIFHLHLIFAPESFTCKNSGKSRQENESNKSTKKY